MRLAPDAFGMFVNSRFCSFAFARILCSLLQRGSAFAKGFGPIKWRGELRRNSAQDTPQLAAGNFIYAFTIVTHGARRRA